MFPPPKRDISRQDSKPHRASQVNAASLWRLRLAMLLFHVLPSHRRRRLGCLAIFACFSATTTDAAPLVDAAAESHRRILESGLFLPCDVALEELALPLSWTMLVLPMDLRGYHTPEVGQRLN